MSVIVKGMKMPNNCYECPCCASDDWYGYYCLLDDESRSACDGRPDWCPLVEITEGCLTCKYDCRSDGYCDDCTDTNGKWEPFQEG